MSSCEDVRVFVCLFVYVRVCVRERERGGKRECVQYRSAQGVSFDVPVRMLVA